MPEQTEPTNGADEQQVHQPAAPVAQAARPAVEPTQEPAQVAATSAQVKPGPRPAAEAKPAVDDRDEFIRSALPVAAALRRSGKPEEAKQLELVANALLQTKSMERAPVQAQVPAKEESIKDLLASVYKVIDQDPALKNMPEAKDLRRAGNKLDKDGMLNITVRNGVVVSFFSNFTDNFTRTQQVGKPALAGKPVVAQGAPIPGAAAQPIEAPAAQVTPPAQQPAPAPGRGEIIYAAAPPDASGNLNKQVLQARAAHYSVFQIQVDPQDSNRAILLPAPGADGRLVNSLRDSMDNAYHLSGRPEQGKAFLAVEVPTQLARTADGWRVTKKGLVGFSSTETVYQAQQLAAVQQRAPQTPAATPFTRADVSVEELAKVGVQVADLEKSGQLQRLLEGKKTDLLPFVLPTSDGVAIPFAAKLVLQRDAQGAASLRVDLPKHELEIPKQVMGKDITPAMQVQLQAHGVVPLAEGFQDGQGQPFAAYLAVDKEMKRVVAVRPAGITVPQQVHGVTLSPEQRQQLLEGRPTRIQGLTNSKQQLVDATVQLDPLARKLTFRDSQLRAAQEQNQHQVQEPSRRRGVHV